MKVRDLKKTPIKKLFVLISGDDFILEFSKNLLVSRISPEVTYIMWGDEWDDLGYKKLKDSMDILGRKRLLLVKRGESIPEKSLNSIKPSPYIYQLILSKEELALNLDKRSYTYAKIDRPGFKESIEIVQYLFRQKGIQVDRDVAQLVFEVAGRNLSDTWQEVEKIAINVEGYLSKEKAMELLFPLEKGGFWGCGEDLVEGRKGEFLKKVKKAMELHIPPLYFLAILQREIEALSAKKKVLERIIEVERDLKIGADWTRIYQLAFEL